MFEWIDLDGDVHQTIKPPSQCETRLPVRGIDAVQAVTDTQRLDWAILHQEADFEQDSVGPYIVAYLTSGDDASGGVSGHFIGRGATHCDCIDSFLRGDVKRID